MAEPSKSNLFTKWLENLQQESWQLELVISGFAIFLLLGSYEPLQALEVQIDRLIIADSSYQSLEFPYKILMASWYILIINLITHVLMRGLWISTIGLRYVSGDIDFDKLNFGAKFDHFFRKRIVSFDHYIQQLEKLCSIIFAFTFLIIFILLSAGIFFGTISFIGESIDWIDAKIGIAGVLPLGIFMFLYLIGGLVYLIDFISLGWIKRIKSLEKIYFPMYRFYSTITLSFIYRPLYYNLIDNKFGKRVILFLIPYIFILTAASSAQMQEHAYLPIYRPKQYFSNQYYDETARKNQVTYTASIPSKYVDKGYIELFLPYNPRDDDDAIHRICPDLKPAKKGTFIFSNPISSRVRINADSALLCHAKRFKIVVNDSVQTDLRYRFYNHPHYQRMGLLTILDVDYLPRGEHNVLVKVLFPRTIGNKDTLVFSNTALIPFWKE